MKLRAVIGWGLCAVWFIFATYVSITGGPNLAVDKNEPDYARIEQIAAKAAGEKHQGGCCSKKEKTESEPGTAKSKCSDTDGLCEHH